MIASTKRQIIEGKAMVPGSKSHTIRGVLLGAMAEGTSIINNPLTSFDCKSALATAELFGAKTKVEDGRWIIEGVGKNLKVPDNYLDCGNSGSVAYFAAPMAALTKGYTFVTGDEQIRRRPIDETLSAIRELGGEAFPSRPDSTACPAIIRGMMKGGTAHFGGRLSQVVSGIMMCAPLLESDTEILIENPKEKPYLQITLDWMKRYGIELENNDDYKSFSIKGNRSYKATEALVPSDWSSVAFPLVAAMITEGEVTISGVDFMDSQGDKAVVDYLIAMGADITKDVENNAIYVKGGKPVTSNLEINLRDIPDSLPALSVAACYAGGDTKFVGLEHVRLKETDRVAVMEEELRKMGADIESGADFLLIHGGKKLVGTDVHSHDDHRVAMAMLVCGLWAEGETIVHEAQCAGVSFPNFFEVMNGIGANISIQD